MFVGFFSWWYGNGLNARIAAVGERLARVADFFSVGLLLSTLFMPFRQISTGSVRGSLDVHIRAFLDNLVSRCIGAFVRSAMIVFAVIAWCAAAVYGVVVVLGWLVLPLLPIVGATLTILGAGA